MGRTVRRALAVAVTLAVMVAMSFLAACGNDGGATQAPATDLKVVVTEIGDQVKLDLPASIDGGVVKLSYTNAGQAPHSLQIVKVAGNHTVAEVITFIRAKEGGPVPDWITEGGGIGAVPPGQTGTATLKLSEGRHVVWDDETDGGDVDNGTKGAIAELDVKAGGGDLPVADATVSAEEYELTVTPLAAGATSVRFVNTGKELHNFFGAPLLPGRTLDDVKAFFATQGEPTTAPPLDFQNSVGAPFVDAGNAVVLDLNLRSGTYVFLCLVNDRAGGPPHFTLGMIQQVTVA